MEKNKLKEFLHTQPHIKLKDNFEIERLGGLTNRNFHVYDQKQAYVFRIPGQGSELIIDREAENIIVEAIKNLNVDAPLIAFDKNTSIKVTSYIDGAITMNAESIKSPHNIQKVAELFSKLHTSKIKIEVDFNPFQMLEEYEKTLIEIDGYLPDNYKEVKAYISSLHHRNTSSLVLCHNDPLAENFILSKNKRMYLVDWEYGGMNNPLWDLADVSIEAEFSEKQDEILLKHYFKRDTTTAEYQDFLKQKLYIDLLWSLWGFIREKTKDDDYDFLNYGLTRYQRLLKNLELYKKGITE